MIRIGKHLLIGAFLYGNFLCEINIDKKKKGHFHIKI